MTPERFLVLNLCLAFYNVGTIWAHEVDIFRSWTLLDVATFHRVQATHWRKVPFWVFLPVGLAFAGSIGLIWYHPPGSPTWAIVGTVGSQSASHLGTALMWGRWQAKLSKDPSGAASPYLAKILSTHWMRTLLISATGGFLVAWVLAVAERW